MNQINAHKRPTFLVAHRYRCHGLIDRETFLAFKKTYEEVIENIAAKKLDLEQEELWRYIRSLFDFDDFADCVPINAANLSIIFRPVQECMNAMATQWNRDISIQKRHKPFVYTIEAARELMASQLNAAPEDIAIVRNGSDPNAVINNGLDYEQGDNIVLFDQNHPTNSADTAFAIRKLRFPNINCRTVSLTGETDPSKQTIIDAFLKQVDDNTRLVSFSEVSHLTGIYLPSKDLCKQIHLKNPNTHVHVDAAQSWGVFKHDVQDMDCDSFCGGAHKWFLGPKETGILYMKKSAAVKFWPKDIGYNGKMEPPPKPPTEPLAGDASRFEMIGQRNDTNLIGLLYTADILGLIGFDVIQARIKFITEKLREGLQLILSKYQRPPFTIETPSDTSLSEGILVIQFVDRDPSKPLLSTALYDKLYEDYKIAVSTKKGNRMRFSPHIYNMEDHVTRCIDVIDVELRKLIGDS